MEHSYHVTDKDYNVLHSQFHMKNHNQQHILIKNQLDINFKNRRPAM